MKKTTAYITDIHLDEAYPIDRGVNPRENWKIILADIASRQIDEIIVGGDIGTNTSNKWFFNSLNSYAEELKITLGNHDSYEEVQKYHKSDFTRKNGEWYYSYKDDFHAYFFLDSSSGEISVSQLEWLESKLRITEKKTIIFIHHPILRVNTPADREFPLTNRERVKESLLKHKQEMILFCGHYHMEDETKVENIRQYITPATSFQFIKEAETLAFDTGTFGYRVIYNTDGQIKTDVILFEA